MSKKTNRTLAGFSSVANDDLEENNNINSENDIDSNSNTNNNSLNDIVESKTTKDKTHVFRGFYLEKDLVKVLDKHTKNKKGLKSEVVNNALRNAFKDAGWME